MDLIYFVIMQMLHQKRPSGRPGIIWSDLMAQLFGQGGTHCVAGRLKWNTVDLPNWSMGR